MEKKKVAGYMFWLKYGVKVYKEGDAYSLYFGKGSAERLVGRFTDPDIIAALTASNFKKRCDIHTFCDILAECVATDADQRVWYSYFILYVFLQLSPDIIKKIDWEITGVDEWYEWSVENDLLGQLHTWCKRTDAYRDRIVKYKEYYKPDKHWLNMWLFNYQFEKILQGYGELSKESLQAEDIDLFLAGKFMLPLVWDMRRLRKLYPDAITADWYVLRGQEKSLLYGTDFLEMLLKKGDAFKESERTVKIINVELVIDPSIEKYFDGLCNTIGVDLNYNDLPKKGVKKIDCDNGSSLIWLPVCLTEYFKDVVVYGIDGNMNIKDYIDARDNILNFVNPQNRIYLAAEKDIKVTSVCRYDGQVYCKTSIGLVKIPDDDSDDPLCLWCEDLPGSYLQCIVSEGEWIPIEKTLDEIVYNE